MQRTRPLRTVGLWAEGKISREGQEAALAHLPTLAREELLLLAVCFRNNHRSLVLPYTNPIARSLCSKGLLVESRQPALIHAYTFLVPQFVWEHLHRPDVAQELRSFLERPEIQEELRSGPPRLGPFI